MVGSLSPDWLAEMLETTVIVWGKADFLQMANCWEIQKRRQPEGQYSL